MFSFFSFKKKVYLIKFFDKNMISMKQKLHGPLKIFKLLGKQLIDVEKQFS